MALPWYQRTIRWGQTNITEIDPKRYDIDWWRKHWKRTQVQGVIINAGGIVAYYPSGIDLHYRAVALEEYDLFGEILAAAREDGLTVLARMDSNRATEGFYQQHPEWFARDRDGNPMRAGDRYLACIFSDYYESFLPDILREIIDRYHPDGFTDNSWSGITHNEICYCENCRRTFHSAYGLDLPQNSNWHDAAYRKWIRWNYDRRLEIWAFNNQLTQTYSGNKDCLWLGMISGNPMHEAVRFRDMRGILEQSQIIMLDYQHRPGFGFQGNSHAGKLLHGLIGWDKLIPESMPMYQGHVPAFRLASKPEPEAQLWMVEGFAGTIQPWWHHISAYNEDRRQYRTAESLMQWHADHEQYLINRSPVASVGIVWSQENIDFYGRDNPEETVIWPYEGFIQALIRARIPYIPVHANHIERDAHMLSVLVLPNVGALSDTQIESIRLFVADGGNVIATGETGLYDEWGQRRDDFALVDLFGVRFSGTHEGHTHAPAPTWEVYDHHSYLRLHPEHREAFYGPKTGQTPTTTSERHTVLSGFEATDILPFGGRLENVQAAGDGTVPITFIPAFPIYPPEFSWMREADSGKPALMLRDLDGGGRAVYLAADIDRCFRRDNLPDHGDLLANVVRWAANGRIPIEITGPGLIDCQIYEQPGCLIVHLVNLTGTTQRPLHEIIPIGPLRVRLHASGTVRSLVSDTGINSAEDDGWLVFEIPRLEMHDVLVIEA